MEGKKYKLSRRDFLAGSGAVLLLSMLGGCKSETLTTTVTSTKTSTLLSTITNASTVTETVTNTGTVTSTATKTATATITETITQPVTRVITDMGGVAVTVPYDINRIIITCMGGATHEVAAIGGAAKIVAQPSMQKFPVLLKIYPDFANLPTVGTFNNINIEEILALEPDVVINSKISSEGNQKIMNAGVPVIRVNTGRSDITGILDEFAMTGELLNNTSRSNELITFWSEQLEVIDARLADIPVENRKRVYYVLGAITHTNGSESWGQALITAAGGINVAEEIGAERDIVLEQLLVWNPDVMILSSNEGTFVSVEDITGAAQLQEIKAVIDRELYLCPVGTFWWDRPAPEAILGITWLAKTLYPEQFADIDLKALSKDFYNRFYNYELSDDEFTGFLNPTA
ncbi:MAG: ABC transporter substrate-binding protein [Dehalococcoidales bacterium]|nr:ABC transporter substrate-binding protein [Dehalococcoidales bacterium]